MTTGLGGWYSGGEWPQCVLEADDEGLSELALIFAAPVIWFLSVLCDSQEGLNALLMLAWPSSRRAAMSPPAGCSTLRRRSRRVSAHPRRVLLAAGVVFVLAWPILGALTSDPTEVADGFALRIYESSFSTRAAFS